MSNGQVVMRVRCIVEGLDPIAMAVRRMVPLVLWGVVFGAEMGWAEAGGYQLPDMDQTIGASSLDCGVDWQPATPPAGPLGIWSITYGPDTANEATLVVGDAMGKSEARHQTLLDKAREQGRIPVIVRLAMDLIPEAALDAQGIQAQRGRLATMQQRVLERLSSTAPLDEAELGVKRFTLTPALALQVDAWELQALLADPEVVEITEDRPAVLFNSIN